MPPRAVVAVSRTFHAPVLLELSVLRTTPAAGPALRPAHVGAAGNPNVPPKLI